VSDEQGQVSEERLHFLDQQRVAVEDFEAAGLVLDLGGGGEGIIGRLKGDQVVAIDASRDELEEAPSGPLKIVMDARDLKFLDAAFEVVTSFFTLMYLDPSDHEQVFAEALRVLVPGGRLLVWGVNLPERPDGEKDVLVLPLVVELPSADVETGYGIGWPGEALGLDHYVEVARRVGFDVVKQQEQGSVFHLSLRRV
jgi:SAM-dependent methyltransferase